MNTKKAEFRLVLRAPSGGNYQKNPALRVVFWRERGRGCFPDSSVGKQSTYNAGDPDLIPGSGRSAGEGITHSSILGLPWWLSW